MLVHLVIMDPAVLAVKHRALVNLHQVVKVVDALLAYVLAHVFLHVLEETVHLLVRVIVAMVVVILHVALYAELDRLVTVIKNALVELAMVLAQIHHIHVAAVVKLTVRISVLEAVLVVLQHVMAVALVVLLHVVDAVETAHLHVAHLVVVHRLHRKIQIQSAQADVLVHVKQYVLIHVIIEIVVLVLDVAIHVEALHLLQLLYVDKIIRVPYIRNSNFILPEDIMIKFELFWR